ncbi:MAG: mevalonate kinase family protein [Candidatus Asgardarchaeia archaeon]
MRDQITVSAPGRITIFGEHQDYLGLPVISGAINRRIYIKGEKIDRPELRISLNDIGTRIILPLNKILPYEKPRQYIKSALNVFYKRGYKLESGYKIDVFGVIPISSGLSSSSALVTAFLKFLFEIVEVSLSPMDLAMLAYEAEVLEFNEPGGYQDHIASSFGGIVYIEPKPKGQIPFVEQLSMIEGNFVIGFSGIRKPTLEIISRIKNSVLSAADSLSKVVKFDSLMFLSLDEIEKVAQSHEIVNIDYLIGALRIRDITVSMYRKIKDGTVSPQEIGEGLNGQQEILRDVFKVSTPQLDELIEIALSNGALGAKIVGAGGGGCIMAYALSNPEDVEDAIKERGYDAFTVKIDYGAMVEEET